MGEKTRVDDRLDYVWPVVQAIEKAMNISELLGLHDNGNHYEYGHYYLLWKFCHGYDITTLNTAAIMKYVPIYNFIQPMQEYRFQVKSMQISQVPHVF